MAKPADEGGSKQPTAGPPDRGTEDEAYGGRSPFVPKARKPLIQRTLPVAGELPTYQGRTLRRDLLAGITVAALAIPSGMAYAELAGLSPVAGLYALLLPVPRLRRLRLLPPAGRGSRRLDLGIGRDRAAATRDQRSRDVCIARGGARPHGAVAAVSDA